ncbi:hypothetical protein BYT27DRAFT_7243094 [Phlegmacium glaucopus]|nr:hypothetical protein BYT27DRAFT_7243094 [Phlegmacium glaucopus]
MFSSKISALSLFVFCLFTLGQAAPVVDDASSLSAREAPLDSFLVTRGILSKLIHKVDPATQKLIDQVSDAAYCKTLHVLYHSEKEFTAAQQYMTTEQNKLTAKGSKPTDPVVKEYAKVIKGFGTRVTKITAEINENKAALKKLGFADSEAHCKSAYPPTTPTTPSAPAASPTHTGNYRVTYDSWSFSAASVSILQFLMEIIVKSFGKAQVHSAMRR